jgi:hypothetical protein
MSRSKVGSEDVELAEYHSVNGFAVGRVWGLKLSLATQFCRRDGIADVRPLLRADVQVCSEEGKEKESRWLGKSSRDMFLPGGSDKPRVILLGVAEQGCRRESIDSATG